jgi:hypothetical protein
LGHEESNRSRVAPALPAERHGERRGHPSRVPSGSLRSPLTGPGRAAGKHSADKREGQALVRPHGRGHTAVMDAEARNQYLRDLREEYCLAPKSVKSRLLDEAAKRTGLARKVIIRKLARPATLVRRPAGKRRRTYDAAVCTALIELWTLFDSPCGQRLVALLREQVPRLRQRGFWNCSDEVAAKLVKVSAKTADRLLAPQRRQLRLGPHRSSSMRRLLLEQIPLKVADEWDRRQVGNLQLDFVAHCGQSTAGSFLWTLSTVDIASNWWEGEPVIDRTQHSTRCALDAIRRRLPFRLREIHPDNDSSVINRLLLDYCRQNQIAVSRSRPLKKNDNCWVEQKNWTHVRKLVGYHRLSGELQYRLLKDLYRVWSLWRNYFQPVMRLESKTRTGSKVHRRYDVPATPCQRLLASGQLSTMARQSLEQRYASLNPVLLRKQIEQRLNELLKTIHRKETAPVAGRKLSPRSVTSFVTQRGAVRLPVEMT